MADTVPLYQDLQNIYNKQRDVCRNMKDLQSTSFDLPARNLSSEIEQWQRIYAELKFSFIEVTAKSHFYSQLQKSAQLAESATNPEADAEVDTARTAVKSAKSRLTAALTSFAGVATRLETSLARNAGAAKQFRRVESLLTEFAAEPSQGDAAPDVLAEQTSDCENKVEQIKSELEMMDEQVAALVSAVETEEAELEELSKWDPAQLPQEQQELLEENTWYTNVTSIMSSLTGVEVAEFSPSTIALTFSRESPKTFAKPTVLLLQFSAETGKFQGSELQGPWPVAEKDFTPLSSYAVRCQDPRALCYELQVLLSAYDSVHTDCIAIKERFGADCVLPTGNSANTNTIQVTVSGVVCDVILGKDYGTGFSDPIEVENLTSEQGNASMIEDAIAQAEPETLVGLCEAIAAAMAGGVSKPATAPASHASQ